MSAPKVTPQLGPWLQQARNAHGLSQLEVCSLLAARGFEVHQTKLSKIESSIHEPTLAFALALFAVLGTTPDAALGIRLCEHCKGQPPAGFTCNTCGRAA